MTYTAKEVEAALAKWQCSDSDSDDDNTYLDWSEFGYAVMNSSWDRDSGEYQRLPQDIPIPDLGIVTGLVSDGGGEGHGEYCEIVFKITAPDGGEQIFRKEGSYYSFHGTDWDGDLCEVIPVVKTVTFYQKVGR